MNTFLFGIHCHQPVDNFDEAVKEAIERSYLPFFRILNRYPDFRFSVHFSGWLLKKIAEEMAELFGLMESMSMRGQIEWLGGGYYEPILASIPSADRRSQINELSDLIEKLFSQRPRGVWLAERVWSDEIIPDLAACGIEYTLVDDYHFWRVGFESDACDGYFISENSGIPIKIFPIQKSLRYLLPFSSHTEAIETIVSMPTAICFDDGEKFGLWPKTYEWVYEKGWLDSFASSIVAEPVIYTTHFSTYIDTNMPRGSVYLPNVSYYEMGEWSYPTKRALLAEEAKEILSRNFGELQIQSVLGGGIWKNFLIKYPESNHIHKRMVLFSQAIEQMDSEVFSEWVYKAQTNDVLWHGVFGGLYLPNLRDNAYRYLIEAQELYSQKNGYGVFVTDFDHDGFAEVTLTNPSLCVIVSTRYGGMVCELDRMEKKFNLQNTLTRRKEIYHETLLHDYEEPEEITTEIETIHNTRHTLSPEAADALHFDWYERRSFADHFCAPDTTLSQLHRCDYYDYGDFAASPFMIHEQGEDWVSLRRDGMVDGSEVSLYKYYRLGTDLLDTTIFVETASHAELLYVSELNFHFANPDEVVIYADGRELEEPQAVVNAIRILTIWDPYLDETMTIELDRECQAFLHPIETVSQSEQGIDLMVQGLMIAFAFPYEGTMEVHTSIRWSKGFQ